MCCRNYISDINICSNYKYNKRILANTFKKILKNIGFQYWENEQNIWRKTKYMIGIANITPVFVCDLEIVQWNAWKSPPPTPIKLYTFKSILKISVHFEIPIFKRRQTKLIILAIGCFKRVSVKFGTSLDCPSIVVAWVSRYEYHDIHSYSHD